MPARLEKDEDLSLRALVCLWLEIITTRVLMWLANPTGRHAFQPHVHLYLADRYGRLATIHRRRARFIDSNRLADTAAFHAAIGDELAPPPAAALAVGSERRRVLVELEERTDPTENSGKLLPFVPRRSRRMTESIRE